MGEARCKWAVACYAASCIVVVGKMTVEERPLQEVAVRLPETRAGDFFELLKPRVMALAVLLPRFGSFESLPTEALLVIVFPFLPTFAGARTLIVTVTGTESY